MLNFYHELSSPYGIFLKETVTHSFIRNSYFRIHSYEMYSLGRLLLIDRWTRPYKTKYLFLIVYFPQKNWNMSSHYGSFLKTNIRKRFIRNCYIWILSYEVYSLGRLLLIDRWARPYKTKYRFLIKKNSKVILEFVLSQRKFLEKKC